MERFQGIIELVKQHYEKVLLVVAFLLLAAAVWLLNAERQKEAQRRDDLLRGFGRKAVKGVPPVHVNVGRLNEAIEVMNKPPTLRLSPPHHLVNPVTWYRAAGGELVKIKTGEEIGMSKMVVTDIRPLNLSIALIRPAISGSGDQATVTGYHMVTTNETAPPRSRRIPGFYALNDTNKPVFILREVKGEPAQPSEMLVELKDTAERISLAPEKPFLRPLAYEADLKYSVNNRTYKAKRKGDPIDIQGQPHKVVDIAAQRVVLSDESNGATREIPVTNPR